MEWNNSVTNFLCFDAKMLLIKKMFVLFIVVRAVKDFLNVQSEKTYRMRVEKKKIVLSINDKGTGWINE